MDESEVNNEAFRSSCNKIIRPIKIDDSGDENKSETIKLDDSVYLTEMKKGTSIVDDSPSLAEIRNETIRMSDIPDLTEIKNEIIKVDYLPDLTEMKKETNIMDAMPDLTEIKKEINTVDYLPSLTEIKSEIIKMSDLPDIIETENETSQHSNSFILFKDETTKPYDNLEYSATPEQEEVEVYLSDDNDYVEYEITEDKRQDEQDLDKDEGCHSKALKNPHFHDCSADETDEKTPSVSIAMSSLGSSPVITITSASSESFAHCSRLTDMKKAGRKKDLRPVTDMRLTEDDLKHLQIPFKHGWRREIVYRNTTDPKNKRSMCDVYYFPPSGKKLRSMVDVSTYLNAQRNSPINLTHFTFKRQALFRPPDEMVRTAGKANKKCQKSSKIKRANKKTTETKALKSSDKKKVTVGCARSPSVATPSANPKENNERTVKVIYTPSSSSETCQTSSTPQSRGFFRIPISSASNFLKLQVSDSLLEICKRVQPKSAGLRAISSDDSVDSFSCNRKVKKTKQLVGAPQNDCGEDDDLQAVLGPASQIIASILRPETQKRPHEETVNSEDQSNKRMKIVMSTAPPGHSVLATFPPSSAAATMSAVHNGTLQTSQSGHSKSIAAYAGQTSGSEHSKSNVAGTGQMRGPSQQCVQCKCLFPGCYAGVNPLTHKSLCPNCARKVSGQVMLVPILPGQQSRSEARLIIPLTTFNNQDLSSVSSPISTITPFTSQNYSSLSSTSSLLADMANSCIHFSSHNAGILPPPPPLTCPTLKNLMTSPIMGLNTTVPALTRLGLSHSRPPPLLSAGFARPVSSVQCAASLPTLPTLRLCPPPLLALRPVNVTAGPNVTPEMSDDSKNLNMKSPLRRAAEGFDDDHNIMIEDVASSSDHTPSDVTGTAHAGADTHVQKTESSVPSCAQQTYQNISDCDKKPVVQRRGSTSSTDSCDLDDYPPVSFEVHANTDGSCFTGEALTTGTLQVLKAAIPMGLESVSLPNSTPVLPQANLTIKKLHSDQSESEPTSTTAQPLMLPKSTSSILDCEKPLALKINNVITEPTAYVYKCNDSIKIILPVGKLQSPSDPGAQLNVSTSSDLLSMPVQTPSIISTPRDLNKPSKKSYLCSFRMLQSSFTIMMEILGYLSLPDLLRASGVCKIWNKMSMQSCLWHRVDLTGVTIRNWVKATQFFNQVGVTSLKLKDIVDQNVWDDIKRTLPNMQKVKELAFDMVPAAVLDTLTEKMPHHANISAELITDSFAVSGPVRRSTVKTVESMTNAVEAVTAGTMSSSDAAMLYQVSERDLVHLASTSDRLTEDEERAVILCCLRLHRMGFPVEMGTMISRCQEMFARRFSTESPIPISDKYCRDLYFCNLPLFTTLSQNKSNDTLCNKLDAYYASLCRLYNSFLPRKIQKADQVLTFDLISFTVRSWPGSTNNLMTVTAVSAMSCCGHILPLMLIWPKTFESKHPHLINVVSNQGMPTSNLVYQYFQKILSIVRERPLVVLCNGKASLFGEKLISTCIHDSVYFHCVPSDIAKYVFPGHHGGMLHMLRNRVSDHILTWQEFILNVQILLKSKTNQTSLSTRLAVSATGTYPLNPKAPTQYQMLNLTISPGMVSALNIVTVQNKSCNTSNEETNKTSSESASVAGPSADNEAETDGVLLKTRSSNSHENIAKADKKSPAQIKQGSKINGESNIKDVDHLKKITHTSKKLIFRQKIDSASVAGLGADNGTETNEILHRSSCSKRAPDAGKTDHNGKKMRKPSKKAKRGLNFRQTLALKLLKKAVQQQTIGAGKISKSANADSHERELIHQEKSCVPPAGRVCFLNFQKDRFKSGSPTGGPIKMQANSVQLREMKSRIHEMLLKNLDETVSCVIAESRAEYDDQQVNKEDRGDVGCENDVGDQGKTQNAGTGCVQSVDPGEAANDSENDVENSDDIVNGTCAAEDKNEVGEGKSEIGDNRDPFLTCKSGQGVSYSGIAKHEKREKHKKKVKKKERRKSVKGDDDDENEALNINPRKDQKKRKQKEMENQLHIPLTDDQTSTAEESHESQRIEDESSTLEQSFHNEDSELNIAEESLISKCLSEEETKTIRIHHLTLMDHDYVRIFEQNEGGSPRESGNSAENHIQKQNHETSANATELVHEEEVEAATPVDMLSAEDKPVRLAEEGMDIGMVDSEDVVEETVSSRQWTKEEEEEDEAVDDSSSHSSSSNRENRSQGDCTNQHSPSSSSSNGVSTNFSSTSGVENDGSRKSVDSSSNEEEETLSTSHGERHVRDKKKTQNAALIDSSDCSPSSDSDFLEDIENSNDRAKSSSSLSDQEDEEEEDDSKCQMCMRSTPPHSKDMLIDWVDCDGNCGRWFHVLCILRSQIKTDPKNYLCPSCRSR